MYLSYVVKVDNVVKAIDEFQACCYRYNIKIVGVPEKGANESAEETCGICVALFREMGADVSINNIDRTHQVPSRNNSSYDPGPKAIICKFVRRLPRDKVMAKRADANKANRTTCTLGFRDSISLTAARVFEVSHRDFKKFSTEQTNSRSSTSIAWPRMVLFIFARVMTQEPIGLRKSVTSPEFKEKVKFPSFLISIYKL